MGIPTPAILLFVGSGNDRSHQAMRVIGRAHAKLLKMLSNSSSASEEVSLREMRDVVEQTVREANLTTTVLDLS
jgi:hypothetical protein